MTGADDNCGGGRQKHTRLVGRLQWGREDGGKQCRRQWSGNDGCDGGRWWWQMTTAMANINDGG